jgi:invasion protein IalB
MSRIFLFLSIGLMVSVIDAGGLATAQQAGSAHRAAPVAGQSVAQAATPAAQPPGDPSAVNEVHGDWIVNCKAAEGQKQCVIVQVQGSSAKQVVFEIQLHLSKDGKTDGLILMPFGLKLDSGAVLTLDDKDFGQPLRFSTCAPQGCLLPVSFPAASLETLKKAKTLGVVSLNFGNGEVVGFKVSLNGFAAAVARVAELTK